MAAFATPTDVAARWRSLTAEETTVATALLDDASAIIRRRVSKADDRISEGTLDAELVRGVAAWMVIRLLRNPNGFQSRTIDDYTERWDDGTSGLFLADDELALLEPAASSGGAFSISPSYIDPATGLFA